MSNPDGSDYWVEVCSECLRASCWHGASKCEASEGAGTTHYRASELRKFHLESAWHFSRANVVKNEGNITAVIAQPKGKMSNRCQTCGIRNDDGTCHCPEVMLQLVDTLRARIADLEAVVESAISVHVHLGQWTLTEHEPAAKALREAITNYRAKNTEKP